MLNEATTEQVEAATAMIRAIGDAIRELREVPSGMLYAHVMGRMSIGTYERIIDTLVRAGVVRKSGDVLAWIGR